MCVPACVVNLLTSIQFATIILIKERGITYEAVEKVREWLGKKARRAEGLRIILPLLLSVEVKTRVVLRQTRIPQKICDGSVN